MNDTTTTTYAPFTAVTWADYPIGLDSEHRPHGWQAESDLEHELDSLAPGLTLAMCRVLVSATGNGLPVVLTWGNKTTTVQITRLHPPQGTQPGRARVRYWGGFDHDVYLDDIATVTTPDYTETLTS